MPRILAFLYGVICYLFFFVTLLYFIAFVGDFYVPKTVSHGGEPGGSAAAATNILLMLFFGLQHSVMARPGFKAWFTRTIPEPIERSTYVLASSLVLALVMWLWRPIEGIVWQFENLVLYAPFAFGWLLVFIATFLINHFDLFGLRQVYLHLVKKTYTHVNFKIVFLYKLVRHPLMLGFLISFWSIPIMTMSHLLFSIGMSIYIFIGIHFEEKDLKRILGKDYIEWRQRTPMVLPIPRS